MTYKKGDLVVLVSSLGIKINTIVVRVTETRGALLDVSEGRESLPCRCYPVYRSNVRRATKEEKRLATFRFNVTGYYN